MVYLSVAPQVTVPQSDRHIGQGQLVVARNNYSISSLTLLLLLLLSSPLGCADWATS
jgi:hypothetical protein